MAYRAQQYLRWGEEEIAPGDPVPGDEAGRDYAGMLRLGQIVEVNDTGGGDTSALEAQVKDLTAKLEATETERDELARQVETLTAPTEPEADGELPADVTDLGGGWYRIGSEEDGQKVQGRQAVTDALAAK